MVLERGLPGRRQVKRFHHVGTLQPGLGGVHAAARPRVAAGRAGRTHQRRGACKFSQGGGGWNAGVHLCVQGRYELEHADAETIQERFSPRTVVVDVVHVVRPSNAVTSPEERASAECRGQQATASVSSDRFPEGSARRVVRLAQLVATASQAKSCIPPIPVRRWPSNAMTSSEERASAVSERGRPQHRGVAGGFSVVAGGFSR